MSKILLACRRENRLRSSSQDIIQQSEELEQDVPFLPQLLMAAPGARRLKDWLQ